MLVPDFSATLVTEPGFQPNSALGFCCVVNSWIVSIANSEAASPARLTELMVLWPPRGSMAVIPSRI